MKKFLWILIVFIFVGCGKERTSEVFNLIEIPDLVLKNDSKVSLWGTEEFTSYSRMWLLGDTRNIKYVLIALHGNDSLDFASETKGDRDALGGYLKSANEGAVLLHPVSTNEKWDPFYQNSVDHSVGFVKAFKQVEKAVGRSLFYQQFSLSGGGRVDRGLLKMLLKNYEKDSTGLNIKEFVDRAILGVHSGESTYNFAGDEIDLRIAFIEKFPRIKASFVHDDSGSEPKEMAKIGKHFVGDSFDINKEQKILNGQVRFWKGTDHVNTWSGHFKQVFFE